MGCSLAIAVGPKPTARGDRWFSGASSACIGAAGRIEAPLGPESTQRIPRQMGRHLAALNASTYTGKRRDCAIRDQRAQESRKGFCTDGADRPLDFVCLLSHGQLRRCPNSTENTLLAGPKSDHDLRRDSAAEYQQDCSKLGESGSIILNAHTGGRSGRVRFTLSR